jgi:serine O-acetyltransferase
MTAHIKTKKDLQSFVQYEKQLYGAKHASLGITPVYAEKSIIWRFLSLLRYEEYHINTRHRLRAAWYKFRRVKLGRKVGFNIGPNIVDKGFLMFHVGPVLINAESVGQNFVCNTSCALIASGHDCGLPSIGNNVIIGYGSVICGNVTIADGVAIGACSFVNKSVLEPNICVAGSPAKKISSNGSSTWGGMKAFEQIKQ